MKGFTLIETVIVIALTGLMLLSLALLYLGFSRFFGSESGSLLAAGDAAHVIRGSEALILPADHVLSSHVFSGTTYSSSTTTLVLEIPSIDSAGAVVSGKYDYAAVYLTGSTTTQLLAPDASSARLAGTKRLARSTSALTFTYNNGNFAQVSQVGVDAATVVVSEKGPVSAERKETIRLRNF